MSTVLVIDDHPANRLALEATLSSMHESVLALDSAREVGAILACVKVDLVITDLHMPQMSGAELAVELCRSNVPVILLSGADADDPSVRRVTALPGVTFLQKPYSRSVLRERIRSAIGR